jgi:hypothetical protein
MKNTFLKSGINRTGLILIFSGALLLLISYFLGYRTVDLHFYDTYYVLPMRPVFFAHSFMLILTGSLVLVFAKNRFLMYLAITGAILTFLSTAGACYALWKSYLLFSFRPTRYIDLASDFAQINLLYLVCIGILIVIQLVFVLIALFRIITRNTRTTDNSLVV